MSNITKYFSYFRILGVFFILSFIFIITYYLLQDKYFDSSIVVENPKIKVIPSSIPNVTKKDCVKAGCGGELCVSADVASSIVTNCVYKAEYACYEHAICEFQPSNVCGWTEDVNLKTCLETNK